MTKTSIVKNNGVEGETLEMKMDRIINNKEPITDGAQRAYTERKDGVRPEYNIRTDRFEVAIDAMDKVSKTYNAKREERLKLKEKDKEKEKTGEGDGGAETVQGTDS